MSTTATKPSSKSAAQARKSFAVQYLEDLVFEIMLNTGQAGKSREIASQLEGVIKLHPKFVRKTLFQSDRFEMEERRWNLALRTMTELSFEGSIEHTLRDYGKPMSQQALQNEMAMIHRRPVDFYNDILPATLRKRGQYWQAPDGCWLLRDWVLDVSESDPDRCFLRNFLKDRLQVRPAHRHIQFDLPVELLQRLFQLVAVVLKNLQRLGLAIRIGAELERNDGGLIHDLLDHALMRGQMAERLFRRDLAEGHPRRAADDDADTVTGHGPDLAAAPADADRRDTVTAVDGGGDAIQIETPVVLSHGVLPGGSNHG